MVGSSTQSFRVVIQVIWIISSPLFGICLCISGTDEQDHKPQPLPKTHSLARLTASPALQ